ncbi:MFS transporter, partial [Actinomadura kijaniata]|uniref:MFS transporter n=1 Tax=Actinomadura kijaniata TaxID=46161 RepID=UPI003F1D3AE9
MASPTQPARPRAHGRLLGAGLIGSSIEWYDFFLYGTAAALVFPKVFFPGSSALAGTLLSFSTFWAGFLARPIGGVVAGHLGDRYGRKKIVVASLLLMGLGTFLIGCLPGAGTIGVLAPVLLVALRFVQGLACGAQWGGIVLLLTESASAKRKGFAGTFGQMGVAFGVCLGNAAFLVTVQATSDEAFLSWGWRVPFLASAVMFPVALYIQARVEDSAEFRELAAETAARTEQVVKAPVAEAVRRHWRTILLAAGLLAGTNALFYISVAGVVSYATTELGLGRDSVLSISLPITLLSAGIVLAAGWISDRVGRRPMILLGGAIIVLWAFPYFWLVDTRSLPLIALAVFVGSVGQSLTYGPLAAYIGELLEPNVRYSGASLAYQLASITISGGTPFLMTAIIGETGSTTLVSVYVAATGLITFVCAWVLKETNPATVRRDPAAVPGAHLYRQPALVGLSEKVRGGDLR